MLLLLPGAGKEGLLEVSRGALVGAGRGGLVGDSWDNGGNKG